MRLTTSGRQITGGSVPTDLLYTGRGLRSATPELEVVEIINPGVVRLKVDRCPRLQGLHPGRTGEDFYREHGNDLKRALSIGHLRWYEGNPSRIPAKWTEERYSICGFASVVRFASGDGLVPYLNCRHSEPFVDWFSLLSTWVSAQYSGLLTE